MPRRNTGGMESQAFGTVGVCVCVRGCVCLCVSVRVCVCVLYREGGGEWVVMEGWNRGGGRISMSDHTCAPPFFLLLFLLPLLLLLLLRSLQGECLSAVRGRGCCRRGVDSEGGADR